MFKKILACTFVIMLTLTVNGTEKKFKWDSPHYGTQQFCHNYAIANIRDKMEEDQVNHYAHFEADEEKPTCYIQTTFEINNENSLDYDKMTDDQKEAFKLAAKPMAENYFAGTTNKLKSKRNVRVKIRLTIQVRTKDSNKDIKVMVADTTDPEFKKGLTF